MGKTILVVEDNELNLRLFCDLLNAHGYSAHPVRDGRDALERAREVSPDLIIMDIQLPHVSGLELIEQMKADLTLRAVPIMAVQSPARTSKSLPGQGVTSPGVAEFSPRTTATGARSPNMSRSVASRGASVPEMT